MRYSSSTQILTFLIESHTPYISKSKVYMDLEDFSFRSGITVMETYFCNVLLILNCEKRTGENFYFIGTFKTLDFDKRENIKFDHRKNIRKETWIPCLSLPISKLQNFGLYPFSLLCSVNAHVYLTKLSSQCAYCLVTCFRLSVMPTGLSPVLAYFPEMKVMAAIRCHMAGSSLFSHRHTVLGYLCSFVCFFFFLMIHKLANILAFLHVLNYFLMINSFFFFF